MKKPNCIELFSGAGGLSLGLSQAGFDVRAAYDIKPVAVSTYCHNLGPHAHVGDARYLTGTGILDDARIGGLDLLAGGPPCQGFSKQRRGAQAGTDDRNLLVLEWARLVRETRPRAFLFENVEAFGQARGRHLLQRMTDGLGDWDIYPRFVVAAAHGLAQRRGRFILMGLRRDLRAPAPVIRQAVPVTPSGMRSVTCRHRQRMAPSIRITLAMRQVVSQHSIDCASSMCRPVVAGATSPSVCACAAIATWAKGAAGRMSTAGWPGTGNARR